MLLRCYVVKANRVGRQTLILLAAAMLFWLPCDRALRTGLPVMAAVSSGAPGLQVVIDAFLKARGVAPGSPGFGWDRVQYRTLVADVLPAPGEEIVVAGTVLPEDGFVVVYGANEAYVSTRATNLARVDQLEDIAVVPEKAPGGPLDLAVVHSYNEMFGAFTRWQKQTYLRSSGKELLPILNITLYEESYSLQPLLAFRQVTEAEVTDESRQGVQTSWQKTLWEKNAAGEYQVVSSEQGRSLYEWDDASFSLRLVSE